MIGCFSLLPPSPPQGPASLFFFLLNSLVFLLLSVSLLTYSQRGANIASDFGHLGITVLFDNKYMVFFRGKSRAIEAEINFIRCTELELRESIRKYDLGLREGRTVRHSKIFDETEVASAALVLDNRYCRITFESKVPSHS